MQQDWTSGPENLLMDQLPKDHGLGQIIDLLGPSDTRPSGTAPNQLPQGRTGNFQDPESPILRLYASDDDM